MKFGVFHCYIIYPNSCQVADYWEENMTITVLGACFGNNMLFKLHF